MSSDVDIAAPGIGLPEGDESETQPGLWRRAYDNVRTGNLGILPIVIGIVDSEEKVNAFLPDLEQMIGGGLVTLEKIKVIHYRHDKPNKN